MLVAGSVLAIGSGAVLSYLYAQPQERPSDLTLANIEALAEAEEGAGVVYCSGGDNKCADVYGKDGKLIETLKMP